MIEQAIQRLGLTIDQGLPTSNGAELRFCCPFCVKHGKRPDTKHHLYLHILPDARQGRWICFRCEAKGRLGANSKEDIWEHLGWLSKTAKQEESIPEVELPDGFVPLDPRMHAYTYIKKRGITDEDIEYYSIGFAQGRIIFPDYLNGKLDYWVSRDYVNQEPRYSNAKVSRASKLYNLGRWLKEAFVTATIVEGSISAIVAGRSALGTYGKLVTDPQVQILRSLPVKEYLIVAESDAREQALELAGKLATETKMVRLLPMPKGEDPASLGRSAYNEVRREALLYDRYDKYTQVEFMLS